MIKNYFKTAWRTIKNNKAYSAINIIGLAGGMVLAPWLERWFHRSVKQNKEEDNE